MYLTRSDIQTIKHWVLALWAVYCSSTLTALFFSRHWFWVANSVLVTGALLYRLIKRYPRRCQRCVKKGDKWLSIFRGWFFVQQYYRTTPTRYRPGGRKEFHLPPPSKEFDTREECHFPLRCIVCGDEYEVKPPELKTFDHRPKLLQEW